MYISIIRALYSYIILSIILYIILEIATLQLSNASKQQYDCF
jgi:hypothetical protein